MRIPARPPDRNAIMKSGNPARLLEVLGRGLKAESDGRYLHWDELRRHQPPQGLTPEEWWIGTWFARQVLRTELPLRDGAQHHFSFARTDSVLLALHHLDRELGGGLETVAPDIASRDVRDRYIFRSLAEEAINSSQLEGASTTRRVAKEMLRGGRAPRTRSEQMIVNNFRGMELLRSKAAEPLSVGLLLELHETLTVGTLDPGDVARLRRPDESIVVQDVDDAEVLHVPPDADGLKERLDALCAFANTDSDSDVFVHPIVRAIILHFMLAYEHPFVDGNGRTARALFYWSMLRQRYWIVEFLSISRIIKRAPSQYARAFLHTETDESDLTYFLLHQLAVIRSAVKDLYAYLDRKSKELKEIEPILRADEAINHRQRTLLAHALRHPGTNYSIAPYRREHGVVYETARQDLLGLERAGYLQKRQVGKAFHFVAVPDLERRLKKRKA